MPNTQVLQVQAGNLPTGYCPASLQDLLNAFSAQQSVNLTTQAGSGLLQVGPNKPSDTTSAWLQVDSQGRAIRTYFFAQGAWLSQHPLPPGFGTVWFATIPNFSIFDGGDGNSLSDISGPMWETIGNGGKFPINIGNNGDNVNGVNTPGQSGGEAQHTLTTAELPANQLGLQSTLGDKYYGTTPDRGATGGPITAAGLGISLPANQSLVKALTDPLGGGGSHNNMPPWVACYILRRTARLFYAV